MNHSFVRKLYFHSLYHYPRHYCHAHQSLRSISHKLATATNLQLILSSTLSTSSSTSSSSFKNEHQQAISSYVVVQEYRVNDFHPYSAKGNDDDDVHDHHDHQRSVPRIMTQFIIRPALFENKNQDVATIVQATSNLPQMQVQQQQQQPSHSTPTRSNIYNYCRHYVWRHLLYPLLPARFPHSVARGYQPYAIYSSLSAIAGSAGMVLSTQTLLLTVGALGNTTATTTILPETIMLVNDNCNVVDDDDATNVDTSTTTTGTSTTPSSPATTVVTAASSSTGRSSSSSSSAAAGALNWIMKDGIGQLGGVLFASKMGYHRSFDSHPKQWRIVSTMALDVANLMEVCSPFVLMMMITHNNMNGGISSTFMILPWACFSSILKNIAFLTAGASKASLHQSLATSGNLADVTAKTGSQMMASSLIGTTLGIGLSSFLSSLSSSSSSYSIAVIPQYMNFTQLSVMAYLCCGIVHQTCNYWAVREVPITQFNRDRFDIVLHHYFVNLVSRRTCDETITPPTRPETHIATTTTTTTTTTHNILSPRIVAGMESLFRTTAASSQSWLTIGSPLSVLLAQPMTTTTMSKQQQQLQQQVSLSSSSLYERWQDMTQYNTNYLIAFVDGGCVDHHHHGHQQHTNNNIHDDNLHIYLTFLHHATGEDMIRGMLHAYFVHYHYYCCYHKQQQQMTTTISNQGQWMELAWEDTQQHFSHFLTELHSVGWSTSSSEASHIEPSNACRIIIEKSM
jgi:hypothetical protein